jgi:hypothetical protein
VIIITTTPSFLYSRKRFSLKYNAYMPEDVTPKSLVVDREAMLQQIMGRLSKNSYVELRPSSIMGAAFPSAPISMPTSSA